MIKRATCARDLVTPEPQLCRKRGECAELEPGVPGIVGTECGRVECGNNAWIGKR